jgi:hypothetical protein
VKKLNATSLAKRSFAFYPIHSTADRCQQQRLAEPPDIGIAIAFRKVRGGSQDEPSGEMTYDSPTGSLHIRGVSAD